MSRSPVAESSLPVFLRAVSTDEFRPAPFSARDVRVRARALDTIERTADRLGRPVHALTGSRAATVAGLLALNGEHGARYYDVAPDAARDEQAAVDAFSGPEIVIDVQTHFIAPHCARAYDMSVIVEMYRSRCRVGGRTSPTRPCGTSPATSATSSWKPRPPSRCSRRAQGTTTRSTSTTTSSPRPAH